MKDYYCKFGTGDPANYTGLSPTFTIFAAGGVTSITAPGITETPAGSGLYKFTYGPTLSILFKVDGGSVLSGSDRYIIGALDPMQAVDEKIGTTGDSIGSTATDPSTVLGYLRRSQEFMEGNASYAKSTGIWSVYSRGSSTLLTTKTLTNTTTTAGKS
jgi:hypothetical protein